MDEKPRTRFRFRIADMLWLVLVVALALGWWLDRGKLAGEAAQLRVENAQAMRLVNATRSQLFRMGRGGSGGIYPFKPYFIPVAPAIKTDAPPPPKLDRPIPPATS